MPIVALAEVHRGDLAPDAIEPASLDDLQAENDGND